MSTTSSRNVNGQPVLVLNNVGKSIKYSNLQGLGDSAELYKIPIAGKRRKSSAMSLAVRPQSQRPKRIKSESVRKNSMSVPQNNRHSKSPSVASSRGQQYSKRSKSVSVINNRRKSQSVKNCEPTDEKIKKEAKVGDKFLQTTGHQFSNRIMSTSGKSHSSVPLEADYSSEPFKRYKPQCLLFCKKSI